MYGQSEIDLKFPTPIPVNITYQTAFVDDAGKLQFRRDVYGRDATMLALLRNSRNKDLETVVAHAQPNYVAPGRQPADKRQLRQRQHYPVFRTVSFFERLFGGPTPAPAAIRPPAAAADHHPLINQLSPD